MTAHCSANDTHQRVETRLAAINCTLAFLTLTNEKPAAVTMDDMLILAEQVERWAWRGLNTVPSPDKAAATLSSPDPSSAPPTTPARRSKPAPPRSPTILNGNGNQGQRMSEQQRNAIIALAKTKGYTADHMKEWVKGQFHKGIDELRHAEAAKLIMHLNAA